MSDLQDEITRTLVQHRPILNAATGGVVGCSCMDRVFVNGAESYDEHIAAVVMPLFEREARRREAWLDRLGAAAGFGSIRDVVEHQRGLGVTGREVPLQEHRVAVMEALIREACSLRDDAATFEAEIAVEQEETP